MNHREPYVDVEAYVQDPAGSYLEMRTDAVHYWESVLGVSMR